MKFRLKAFGLHLGGSACVLALVWGSLYLGWYRWPGWYLADVLSVVGVMAGVDLALGPLLTLVIASAAKPRRELVRDIGVIVLVQLAALLYGSHALWSGRPLYYTYSEGWLEMVRASDIDEAAVSAARERNPEFAPRWYSLPRWVWAPLPHDRQVADAIMRSAVISGADVTGMPVYFKPWDPGLPELRGRLKSIDQMTSFSAREKQRVKDRMQQLGIATGEANTLPMNGRGRAMAAVFDPVTAQVRILIPAR
jgi:hypothetical protein